MKFVFEWSTPPVPARSGRLTINAANVREARAKLSDRIDAEMFSYKQIEPPEEPKPDVKGEL